MGGAGDSAGGGIDAAAKAAFLAALRDGARREDAAAAAGFSLTGFYGARRRDPAFAAAWAGALASPPAAGRRTRAYAERGEPRIAPANRRLLQRRRRHVRFDLEHRERFLAHFAWSCDARAAAAEAGVSESTVYLHRRTDPGFAEEFERALDQGYVRLEVEAVRERLAAQQALRAAVEASEPPSPALPADTAAEFERVLKLLARRDRKPRAPDGSGNGRRHAWTFESAIALLDRRLNALGLVVPPLPPDFAARYDGPAGPDPDEEP